MLHEDSVVTKGESEIHDKPISINGYMVNELLSNSDSVNLHYDETIKHVTACQTTIDAILWRIIQTKLMVYF